MVRDRVELGLTRSQLSRLLWRSRSMSSAVLFIAAATMVLLLGRGIRLPLLSFDAIVPGEASAPLLALAPGAFAIVVATWAADPFPELEQVASRPAQGWRLAQIIGLLGVAALALTAASMAGGAGVDAVPLRNLCGFTGLALLAARLAGARAAWAGPTVMLACVVSFGVDQNLEPRLWAWPLHAAGSPSAVLFSAAALGLGSAVVVMRGTRPAEPPI